MSPESRLQQAESSISQRLMREIEAGAASIPKSLLQAMQAGSRGGKRLRSLVTLASAEAVGQIDPPLGAACAVELVHCYSLIHDDLPAMDDAALRRGEPTVHRAFGQATAILAGDALLALAFEVLASEGLERARPAAYLLAAKELGRAAGPWGMVGGQAIDMGQKLEPPATFKELELCHAGKTAALFSAAAAIGGLCGGASPEATQVLRGVGFDLGLAFQHADDTADNEHLRFRAEAARRAEELCDRASATLDRFAAKGDFLRALVKKVRSRAHQTAA